MIRAVLQAGTEGAGVRGSACALAADVVLVLLEDGTARLLDLGGNFYALSATAASLLGEALRADRETAARRVADDYGTAPKRVRADLDVLLANLGRAGLVRAGPAAGRARASLPPALLTRAHRAIHAWGGSVEARAFALLALAYLAVRLWGWPQTVRAWQQLPRRRADPRGAAAAAVVTAARAVAARHPLNIQCKELALCCWSLLRGLGLPARLVVGIDFFPFGSHCWCELGGEVLSDFPDRCERYWPVLVYD